MEVRMEMMSPKEIEEAMARCPTLFLPLGTIEWHGTMAFACEFLS